MKLISKEPHFKFDVHVVPKSSRNEILGFFKGKLKVKVSAPPEDDKANDRLIELVSDAFDVPKSKVKILRGHTSRLKIISVEGITKHRYDYIVNRFTN